MSLLPSLISSSRAILPLSVAGWSACHAPRSVTSTPVVRELGLPHNLHPCLDDPWACLEHTEVFFAAVVGRGEACLVAAEWSCSAAHGA